MRRKKFVSALFVVAMTLSLLPLLEAKQEGNIDTKLVASQSSKVADSAIRPLTVIRKSNEIQAADDVKPYGDYWYEYKGKNIIQTDLSDKPGLTYSLSVSKFTKFMKPLPAGYDKDKIIEWGKYPGLNVDILHKHGFTGKGAVIAYIDQPIAKHEQYTRDTLHYKNNTDEKDSMHGPAVLSLLTGKDIGTAPEAEVYFYSNASWKRDQTTHAACLYQIIEQNKSLPEGKKIRMVGFSDNIDEYEANADAFREAVKACENAGVMVWFCGDYGPLSFIPFADKNNFANLYPEYWWKMKNPRLVFVPCSGRTSAATLDKPDYYIYWGSGGLSWAMPYVLGLYAIAVEIEPALTQDDLRRFIADTAYVDGLGRRIINPVGFVAAVLKKVGRNEEAQAMLDEVKARTKYLYAVIDTAKMTEKDLTAIGDYLASITEATVLIVDVSKFSDPQSVYTAVQNDAKQRGGTVSGLKVFGEPSVTPTFEIGEIKSDAACLSTSDSKGYITNAPTDIWKPVRWQSCDVPIVLTSGKPTGDSKEVKFTAKYELMDKDSGTIRKCVAQLLDNGHTRFSVVYSMPERMEITIKDIPYKGHFRYEGNTGDKYSNGELVFDLKNEYLAEIKEFGISFYEEKGYCCFFIETDQLK